MDGQLSLFDCFPALREEPAVGEYVKKTGQVICHIMREGYIGHKVLINVSTQSQELYRCGILEDYFFNEFEGVWRSIVYTGERQRSLIDHREGINIYECLPWDCYEKRMAAIRKKGVER